MKKLIDLMNAGQRWRDLAEDFGFEPLTQAGSPPARG